MTFRITIKYYAINFIFFDNYFIHLILGDYGEGRENYFFSRCVS